MYKYGELSYGFLQVITSMRMLLYVSHEYTSNIFLAQNKQAVGKTKRDHRYYIQDC